MTMLADVPVPVDALGVTVGVDTHLDTHVVGVIDSLEAVRKEFPVQCLDWPLSGLGLQ